MSNLKKALVLTDDYYGSLKQSLENQGVSIFIASRKNTQIEGVPVCVFSGEDLAGIVDTLSAANFKPDIIFAGVMFGSFSAIIFLISFLSITRAVCVGGKKGIEKCSHNNAYLGVSHLLFEGRQYRSDIGRLDNIIPERS